MSEAEITDIEVCRVQAPLVVQAAEAFEITCDEDLQLSADEIADIKRTRKNIAAYFRPTIDNLHLLHKAELKKHMDMDLPFARAEDIRRRKHTRFTEEREAERQAEIRRIEAEQRKLEEARQAEIRRRENEERTRLEAIREAERKRLYAEGKRKEAAIAAARPVEVIIDEPPEIDQAPVVLPPEPPKIKGLSQTKRFDFEVKDAALIPDAYWVLDEKTIRALVVKLGPTAEKVIPGIRVIEVAGISVRG